MSEEKPFLTSEEAADLLGISTRTLYNYAARPGFPVVKRGRLFFPKNDLISWWRNPKNS